MCVCVCVCVVACKCSLPSVNTSRGRKRNMLLLLVFVCFTLVLDSFGVDNNCLCFQTTPYLIGVCVCVCVSGRLLKPQFLSALDPSQWQSVLTSFFSSSLPHLALHPSLHLPRRVCSSDRGGIAESVIYLLPVTPHTHTHTHTHTDTHAYSGKHTKTHTELY